MSSINDYYFNSMGRLGSDTTDNTQRNLQNTKFSTYMLSEYFSGNLSDAHIKFATQQPAMNVNSKVHGNGINSNIVDIDSLLMIKTTQDRPLEKLQLMQRPFATVPFLGRGSCDTTLELQLLHGDTVHEKKSTSTIMSQSFMGYTLHPLDEKMEERVKNPANTVEEAALDGWVRGGMTTREMINDSKFNNTHRPNNLM